MSIKNLGTSVFSILAVGALSINPMHAMDNNWARLANKDVMENKESKDFKYIKYGKKLEKAIDLFNGTDKIPQNKKWPL